MKSTIRDYQPPDLGRVMQLWERAGAPSSQHAALTLDQAVDLMHAGSAISLIAGIEGEIVGVVLGSAEGSIGWVHRLVLLPDRAHEAEVAEGLLENLETRLAAEGARRLGALVSSGDPASSHLERRDYRPADGTRYLIRDIPAALTVPTDLGEVWGRIIAPGLWDELRGLESAKELIERRVILPLAEPELARRHSVAPPRAIVLLGPPGTGKTTFAKGVASRLGWPFIEVQPAELGGDGPERQASFLAATFDRVLELPTAVTFVDEVEDLASIRHEQRRASPSVTNEFLRQIPRLREAEGHLLVCATNRISGLDPAFLRPGRFDHILPVGPPDGAARTAIWERYVERIAEQPVAIPELVEASELFTPADIEFAAHKAAQRAFEREYFGTGTGTATTEDFKVAIAETRPTLTAEVVEEFELEKERYARL